MSGTHSAAVETARAYYNSDDADRFYSIIWGGEDIHVGLYRSKEDTIFEASRRTVERMADLLGQLPAGARVLDLGSGYGGAARYLAQHFDCTVVGLNLSEVENSRARELNREKGLDAKIEIIDGSFESIPCDDNQFDVVWSQDAILHSGDRKTVLAEAARVLRPGGQLLLTDPMQSDSCPPGVLQPILDRLQLQSLASPAFYRAQAARHGLSEVAFHEQTKQLVEHYGRVLSELERRQPELTVHVSDAYVERMKKGLRNWVNGGREGYLAWGMLHFRKPELGQGA